MVELTPSAVQLSTVYYGAASHLSSFLILGTITCMGSPAAKNSLLFLYVMTSLKSPFLHIPVFQSVASPPHTPILPLQLPHFVAPVCSCTCLPAGLQFPDVVSFKAETVFVALMVAEPNRLYEVGRAGLLSPFGGAL